MAEAKSSKSQAPKDVMGFLNYYLVTKAPFQLPAGLKEWIVKFGPWIDLIVLILFAPVILLAIGLGTVALPLSTLNGVNDTAGLSLSLFVLVGQVVLMIAALPGLFQRKKMGWNLAFYSTVVSLVYSLVTFNILGGIIGFVIGSYILFQIRSYYK